MSAEDVQLAQANVAHQYDVSHDVLPEVAADVNAQAVEAARAASLYTRSEPRQRQERYGVTRFVPGQGYVNNGNGAAPAIESGPATHVPAEAEQDAEEPVGQRLARELRQTDPNASEDSGFSYDPLHTVRLEQENPRGAAYEAAYTAELKARGITGSDELRAEDEAAAVAAGNGAAEAYDHRLFLGEMNAKIAEGDAIDTSFKWGDGPSEPLETVEQPQPQPETVTGMPPIDRSKGAEYRSMYGGQATETEQEITEEADTAVQAMLIREFDNAEATGDYTEYDKLVDIHVEKPTAKERGMAGFKKWAGGRFSAAMGVAKRTYDKLGLPTKEDLRNLAQVSMVGAAVLSEQVQAEAKSYWHAELKPNLQVMVGDLIGKAGLPKEVEAGLQDGWMRYVGRNRADNQQRQAQATAAEAARQQAFFEAAAASQAQAPEN